MKNRKSKSTKNSHDHESDALVHLVTGKLMNPDEVQLAMAELDAVESEILEGHWALCGDVSEEMFDYILEHSKEKIFHRITTLNGAGGGKYLVVATQVSVHQHRFLVPLYEQSCISFLVGLCFQPLALMMGREGARESLVLFPDVEPRSLWSFVSSLHICEPFERFRYEAHFALVACEVSQLDRIEPLNGAPSAESLSLTAVLPQEFPAEFYDVWTEVLRMKPAYEDEITALH
jgi:hypothetical protein